VKYATHQLSPAEEKEVLDAMNFVISCAPDNKAVIYTEARDILNVPYSVCLGLINEMGDENPKKWYLRGILEADNEEKRINDRHKADYIPNYLAFFDHSFELEPSYKWLYFTDGQISDELREKYKWSKRKRQKYRDLFSRLVVLSDEAARQAQNEDVLEISGDDDIDENGETTADAIQGIGTVDVPAAGDTTPAATTPTTTTTETNK
jgi:hypothetical protein